EDTGSEPSDDHTDHDRDHQDEPGGGDAEVASERKHHGHEDGHHDQRDDRPHHPMPPCSHCSSSCPSLFNDTGARFHPAPSGARHNGTMTESGPADRLDTL